MIYDIKIKGHRDPIRVENGTSLKMKWEQYIETKKDGVVDVAGWTGRLSDIGSFKLVSDSRSSNSEFEDKFKKIEDDRKQVLKQTPEQRAKNMGLFRLVYWGFTGKRSEEVKLKSGKSIEDMAQDIQLKFFKENPGRQYCDPHLFKAIIKSRECDSIVIRTVENIINNDKQLAFKGM